MTLQHTTLLLHLNRIHIRLPMTVDGAILSTGTASLAQGTEQAEAEMANDKEPVMLSLLKARRIVDHAIRRARELNLNISVAVCDHSGRLIALNQMDQSRGWESDRCSIGKAVAAAVSGLPSDRFVEHMQQHGMRSTACKSVVPPRGQRGGFPIIESGVVEGGCGVSGAATAEQDEECARAGIEETDHTATEPSIANYADRASASFSIASSP